MNTNQKYIEIFKTAFQMSEEDCRALAYGESHEWDSVAHMMLIADIETNFGVELSFDDIIAFSSFEVGKEILGKFDVQFSN